MEGGVFRRDKTWWSTVWAALALDRNTVIPVNGARFPLPTPIAKAIEQGWEMGPAIDRLIGEDQVSRRQGMIGVITKNFVDRTEEYQSLVKMALGLWYGRNWTNKIHTPI